jgi:uncharacterized protein YyaL (SSP411 family)
LANETSPYLQQHQDNPVDWYPWGPEALARAKAEDKPILLSIGYSACHWCHVMEHESFEDDATAQVMNAHFVNIKVDREERPDLDEIYMRAVQAFTGGHGGWPMTVFLTPDGRPFFGGTYFPPEPRHRMPSFRQVLAHASGLYANERDKVEAMGERLREHLSEMSRLPRAQDALRSDWLEAVTAACAAEFDPEHAGFGTTGPKFPPCGSLAVLLAAHHRSGDAAALTMALETLNGMAKGGMYDVLGGGFARYSVDAEWRVPHFEKMLYDNGQLIPLYVDAWKITEDAHYARIVRESCGWLMREMRLDHGGFAASQDADTEGHEGRFFAWTPAQIRQVAGVLDGLKACALLQVTDAGTFEHGTSVLRLEAPLESLAEDDRALIERVLPKLLAERETRVHPGRDDKVVTSWNALTISALARAGVALDEPAWIDAAQDAARFLQSTVTVDGRLQRSFKDGTCSAPGFLDDHTFLIQALLDLYEARFDTHWLDAAVALAETTLALFWDTNQGGFFYTGSDAESLVTRSKNLIAGAIPSGNGMAALALTRLEALTGRTDLGDAARRILASYQALLDRAPRALGEEALAAAWQTGPALELGLSGGVDRALLARERYLPFAVRATTGVPWMAARETETPTAWLCERGACKLPTSDPAELSTLLDQATAPVAPETPPRQPAPSWTLDGWLNGAALSLEQLAGHVVVLDFWTSCCVNCHHVLPELAAIEARFAGRPVVVIGVHAAKFDAEKDPAFVQRAVERLGIRHPVINDPTHALWQAFGVRSWPTVAVLDTQGKVAWQEPGEVHRDVLGRVIEDLLGEAEPVEPVWHAAEPVQRSGLRFPAKLEVFPTAQTQARGAALDDDARVYVSDQHRILECVPEEDAEGWPVLAVLRSWGDGTPGSSDSPPRFRDPQGMSRDGDVLYVADTGNHLLRAIDLASGQVRTIAGTGQLGRSAPVLGPDPLAIDLRSPMDVSATEGMVFIAMGGQHQLWLLNPASKQLSPAAGTGQEHHVDGAPDEAALAQPTGMELLGRYLFWVDAETSSLRVFDLADGKVGTLAGQGLFDWGDVDGAGAEVRFQHPKDVTGVADRLFVADTFNGKVKQVLLSENRTSTLASGLQGPSGLVPAGDFVLVAETDAGRIQAVNYDTGEARVVEVRWS